MAFRRLLFVVLLAAVISACSMGGGGGGGTYGGGGGGGTVKGAGWNGSSAAGIAISGYVFSPSSVTFPAKDSVTITWTNYDGVLHSVTPDSGNMLPSFGSDVSGTGMYSYTVPNGTPPGTYTYHCRIHTYMTGSITVQ